MSLGPLPTAFKPPAECLSSMKSLYTATHFAAFIGPLNTEDGCFPPGYRAERESYFSPATACPEGYSTACARTQGTETQVTCCPNPGGMDFGCIQTQLIDWEKTLVCSTIYRQSIVFPTMTHVVFVDGGLEIRDSLKTSATASPVPGGIDAYGVQIRYRAVDLEQPAKETSSPDNDDDDNNDDNNDDNENNQNEETSSAKPRKTTITLGGEVFTTVVQNSSPTDETEGASGADGADGAQGDADQDDTSGQGSKGGGSSGPSKGAIAGIAVGTALGVIALGALVAFLLWRRGKTGLLGFAGVGRGPMPAELGVVEKRGELSTSNYPARELDGRTPPTEVPGRA